MATTRPPKNDSSLPFGALQLLAPPVRLVSAALWKVLKQKDVMHYGVVEEFVTSACETVPGLLTPRHQGRLTLGLTARLILELCRTQPDAKVITPHLERVHVPVVASSSSASAKKDVKLLKTVTNFRGLIHTLLRNPAERERFYKERFPVDYGSEFDQELEKLLWEFLIRLDQLLPVPSLAQTVSWLSETPPVLEECAQAATQPQLLKILLQHQTCLGHLEPAASLPPNMGESILASLSLPLSGKVMSAPPTGSVTPRPRETTSFITPVIGLLSGENIPIVVLTQERMQQSDEATNSKVTLVEEDGGKEGEGQEEEERSFVNQSSKLKRKEADKAEAEEAEVVLTSRKTTNKQQRIATSNEGEAGSVQTEECEQELFRAYLSEHGLGKLRLPKDPSLRSVFTSCLSRKPNVVIKKLTFAPASCSVGTSFYKKQHQDQRNLSPCKQTNSCQTPQHPRMDDKENQPVLSDVSGSSSLQPSHTEAAAHQEDAYVTDSEDEATKNFKGRLFIKRYHKTKHGTYVPTLREFWKPIRTQLNSSTARKRR
uniref:TERF1 (TRF1)-interacting nuclear factor 2 n=1 Tax=Iconisemion striatum TaxID=60296 RepID=A0A1A7X2I9_9TELE